MGIKDADYWFRKGEESYDSGNLEEAIKCYREAARLEPRDAHAFYNWGIVLSKLADIKQEESLFLETFDKYDMAIQLKPYDADFFNSWGSALSRLAIIKQDVSLFEEAFEKYNKATQLKVDDATFFYNWGIALSELANIKQDELLFEEALKKYDKAIQLEPKDAKLFYRYGDVFFKFAIIKLDVLLFKKASEKYEHATKLGRSDYITFVKWGTVLSNIAVIEQNELLFKEAFEKYNTATNLNLENNTALINWGSTLSSLAYIKQDESLFREAFEKYDKAIQIKPNDADVFYNWGNALSKLANIQKNETLYLESIKKYYIATQLKPDYVYALRSWGRVLCNLAKTQQHESFFFKEVKKFENASQNVNDPQALLIKGEMYFILNQKNNATECFKNSKKSILEILVFLNNENREKIILTDTLYPLLDLDICDGKFFKEATKSITDKNELKKYNDKVDSYKEIYIRSIFIITLLHVKDENEKMIAHYVDKTISQKILFDNNSQFRLNAINYSNDPTEGEVLLSYLFGEENRPAKEFLNSKYGAFAGCFTFSYDSLNQFRLYGKEDGKEGVGLSLVFRDSFFNVTAEMALKQKDSNFAEQEEEQKLFHFSIGEPEITIKSEKVPISKKKKKLALFRCIYVDPIERLVI
jgi:tetratricopeptide (TPR) repeat protein